MFFAKAEIFLRTNYVKLIQDVDDRSKGPRIESLETCYLLVFGNFAVLQKCRETLPSSREKKRRLSFPKSELFIGILLDATLFEFSIGTTCLIFDITMPRPCAST